MMMVMMGNNNHFFFKGFGVFCCCYLRGRFGVLFDRAPVVIPAAEWRYSCLGMITQEREKKK
jgi:hypothetical protein